MGYWFVLKLRKKNSSSRKVVTMRNLGLWLLLLLLIPSSYAAAQPAPAELKVDVPTEDLLSWEIAAGGSVVTGNTQSYGATVGTQFDLVRSKHRFNFGALFLYNRSKIQSADSTDPGTIETTAKNLNSHARYEYYFRERDAVFLGVKHRWDTFAGLDTRLQIQPGYLRVFHENKEKERRFWGEVGYDFTYDNLYPNPLPADPETGAIPADAVFTHAGRIFLGWDARFQDYLRILTGLEALLNFQEIGDLRLNWNTRVSASIHKRVELGVQFLLLYDRIPVPTHRKLDTYLLANLIVNLL